MRRTLVALACLIPFAAACAGSSRHSTTAPAVAPGGAPAAAAGGAPASSSASTASDGSNGLVESTTTKPPHFSGSSGSSWCDLARQVDDSTKVSQEFTKDPKGWMDTANSVLNRAESRAPSAINGDVHTIAGAFKTFSSAVASAGYDFTKVNQAQLSALADPKIEAAGQRIVAYDQQVCGTKS
jgi:hypothetical protein